MPIQRQGDYLVTSDLGITASVGIESERISECVAEAKSYGGVFGSPFFGFREGNLDFLSTLGHLRQIWFWDCKFSSIDGIYGLRDLEYCGVMEKRPGIDYSRFPRLRTLVTHWNAKDLGLGASISIRKLYLWHHKSASKTFEGVSFPPNVEELELNWTNATSLAGVDPLPKLRELGIHRSRNMENLSMLPFIAPNLKKLIVTTSKRVIDFTGIQDHPSLELAIIDGKRIRG